MLPRALRTHDLWIENRTLSILGEAVCRYSNKYFSYTTIHSKIAIHSNIAKLTFQYNLNQASSPLRRYLINNQGITKVNTYSIPILVLILASTDVVAISMDVDNRTAISVLDC